MYLTRCEQRHSARWDLLAINCGLDDIKRAVELDDYKRNLIAIRKAAQRLAGAVVWIRTTPVISALDDARQTGGFHRTAADVVIFNEVADEVMSGLPSVDLFKLTELVRGGPAACVDHVSQANFVAGELRHVLTCGFDTPQGVDGSGKGSGQTPAAQPEAPSELLFADQDALRRRLPKEGNGADALTVLDCTPANILMLSQGSWDLCRKDLLAVGIAPDTVELLEQGPCAQVLAAFEVRRELVNYKKVHPWSSRMTLSADCRPLVNAWRSALAPYVFWAARCRSCLSSLRLKIASLPAFDEVCLHLFEEARLLQKRLQQMAVYFFWQGVCPPYFSIPPFRKPLQPRLKSVFKHLTPREEKTRGSHLLCHALPFHEDPDQYEDTVAHLLEYFRPESLSPHPGAGTSPPASCASQSSSTDRATVADDAPRVGLSDEETQDKADTADTVFARIAALRVKKRSYLVACRAMMQHRGVLRAIHDARDIAKAICLTPRSATHPNMICPG